MIYLAPDDTFRCDRCHGSFVYFLDEEGGRHQAIDEQCWTITPGTELAKVMLARMS